MIDLRQVYLHLEVDDESKPLMTINTHKGLYRYNRLLFGIASAPAIWQRTMNQVLNGLGGVQCMLDDMIITGSSDEMHLHNLRNVLQRLQNYGLRANLQKCYFLKENVTYCGHEISAEGLGAVLSHVMPDGYERPIAFASRSLTKSEMNYAQIQKEALGILWE